MELNRFTFTCHHQKNQSEDLASIHELYYNFLTEDIIIQTAVKKLLYEKGDIKKEEISLDSLIKIAARMFYEKNAVENKVSWTICVGPGIFPEIYGAQKSYETVVLQAFCSQLIWYEEVKEGETGIGDIFTQFIKKMTYKDGISATNKMMWDKMENSEILRNAVLEAFKKNEDNLYFSLRE